MRTGRDHHNFKHGLFSGYSDYRYGSEKPVTVAKPRRILNDKMRGDVAGRVSDVMADWRQSEFEHEGSCRHGLRRGFCLEGFPWERADTEAAQIVALALRGTERPSWEQGQPEWADCPDHCSWCKGPIDEEGRTRRQRFCCADCAKMALARRDRKTTAYAGAVLRSAERLITKEKAPSKPCAWCAKPFQSDRGKTRFCSVECAGLFGTGDRILPKITCEGCGTEFQQAYRKQRFCTHDCSMTSRWAKEREKCASLTRPCQNCSTLFTPTRGDRIYCSPVCGRRAANNAYTARKRAERDAA